jgi:hypothetical protein
MLVRSLLFACFLFFMGNMATMAQAHDYVGVKKCKMCHNKPATGAQFKQWSESKHATAMQSLKGDEVKDPKCLKCHATAGTVKAANMGTLTVEEGVSCESCHGPGADYNPTAIMKDRAKAMAAGMIIPDEKLCKTCHNPESPHYKGFNYAEYNKKITHPNPAAAK